MSIKTRRERRIEALTAFGHSLGMALSIEKWRVVRDILATCILGYLAYIGTAPQIGVFFIGVINTVTVAELYKAIKAVQRKEQQRPQTDSD